MVRQFAIVLLAIGAPQPAARAVTPSDCVASSLRDPALAALVAEALERSPVVAAARARRLAAGQEPARMLGLPDPMIRASAMLEPFDLREEMVGVEFMVSQELPPKGSRALAADVARWEAAAAGSRVEAARLATLSAVRQAWLELARIDEEEESFHAERLILRKLQDSARDRFAAGDGRQHEVLRVAVALGELELRASGLEPRRAALRARINGLRDRPTDTPIARARLPPERSDAPDAGTVAFDARPEARELDAMIRAAEARVGLARTTSSPAFELSGWYLNTGSGDDDGDEIGLAVGVTLPIHERRIAAEIEQGTQARQALAAERRAAAAALETEVGQARARIARADAELAISSDVLAHQAGASVDAALAAYSSGVGSVADVLEGERMRVTAALAAASARADRAMAVADLEGLLGAPLEAGSAACEPEPPIGPVDDAVPLHPDASRPSPPIARRVARAASRQVSP